jgi:hypothetical protein
LFGGTGTGPSREDARMAEKKEIALSLLKDNMPIDFVVKHTGLKKNVVEGLVKRK